MFTISLKQLQFFSHHGIHAEERILGNDYEVNVSVEFHTSGIITEIGQTINYATLYTIVEKRMAIPTPLLETVAQELVETIRNSFPGIHAVTVSIDKKYPPVPNIRGSVGVSYTWPEKI